MEPTKQTSDPATQSDERTPPPSPPPMRGPRLWIVGVIVLVAIVAAGAGMLLSDWLKPGVERVGELVSAAAHDDHDHASEAEQAVAGYWTCGMHPWVILPEPGLCPICHMDLTPLDPAKLAGEIAIDPVVVQNIGVRIAAVTTGPVMNEIRTVGSVTYDGSTVRVVNTKIGGWVEELFVDREGAVVAAGDPLFAIYSPELYAAQEEYLLAHRSLQNIDAEALPEAAQSAKRLLDAARTRLAYFDITEAQIATLERAGSPTKTLVVSSPHTGVVTEKLVNEGVRIEPGTPTYRIADLSRVWVDVTLYEYQLPFVRVGQPATMSLAYLPGETFEGEVDFIYPYLDEGTRQVRVRLEFPNPNGRLKPGMFAQVRLRSTLTEEAVLAPREAIIATGERAIAFVSLGTGRFEPREVKLGAETGDGRVQVLEGLEPGERVVTSGQFLLDSESKMRAALASLVSGDRATDQAPVHRHATDESGDAEPQAATCPVTGLELGAMGEPVSVEHEGMTIQFCCAACPPKFRADPDRYLVNSSDADAEGATP